MPYRRRLTILFHEIFRDLQPTGIQRRQLPSALFIGDWKLNRLIDASGRETNAGSICSERIVVRMNSTSASSRSPSISFSVQEDLLVRAGR